ncbi:MAG TPA: cysteine desulfurase family protein [Candidatus Binataceae bacterium]|nr:cysteine desulfurase family protein [Candidatus Binataceae bacterium]
MRIYLDHNAAAPLKPAVREACAELAEFAGNPASIHHSGQRARRLLEQARERIAALIEADPRRVIFTSGGTESNNLAIFGTAIGASARRRIVSSTVEHSSIIEPLAALQERGFEIVRLPVDSDGHIDTEAARAALDSATALVTLGLANSESGTIQNLAPLAAAIRSCGALFHIDAAQALGRIPVSVAALGCDLITLSGHKLGAPAGIGGLYVRDPARLAPLILGGPQEYGVRAGTPNLSGAVGFGVAADTIRNSLDVESARSAALAERLLAHLLDAVPGLTLNGPRGGRLPNTLNLTFPAVAGESLLLALDLEGVEVSMGSACAAGSVEPSHVLLAMGRDEAAARSSLRISLGWSTTVAEIDQAAEIIPRVWRRVSAAEPLRPSFAEGASR